MNTTLVTALFDLKRHYSPTIFKGVWDKFNKLCDEEVIISVKEVYNEIKRGSDWLLDWADQHYKIFFMSGFIFFFIIWNKTCNKRLLIKSLYKYFYSFSILLRLFI